MIFTLKITAKAINGTTIKAIVFLEPCKLKTEIAPAQRPIINPPQYIEI